MGAQAVSPSGGALPKVRSLLSIWQFLFDSLPHLRVVYDLQASTPLQTVAKAAEVVMCWCRRPPGGSN